MKALILIAILACMPASAGAQDRIDASAVGGLTFQSETAGLFGAEAGVHVTPNLVIFGQAGRMLDVLPRSVRDDLDDAAGTLQLFTGRLWVFDAKVRATYAGGGAKYIFPLRTRVRPYVAGSINSVSYQGSLEERELGDVLEQAIVLGAVDEDDVSGTEIGYELGGGVMVPAGRARFDLGYRLLNVKGVNISRIVAGLGWRF